MIFAIHWSRVGPRAVLPSALPPDNRSLLECAGVQAFELAKGAPTQKQKGFRLRFRIWSNAGCSNHPAAISREDKKPLLLERVQCRLAPARFSARLNAVCSIFLLLIFRRHVRRLSSKTVAAPPEVAQPAPVLVF